MSHQELLKEMKGAIGKKDPIEFFNQLIDLNKILFERLDKMELLLSKVLKYSALSVHWDPKMASNMLYEQVEILRKDKDTYFNEISALKEAYVKDTVTQNYNDFCQFWQLTLGWHPFLDYGK